MRRQNPGDERAAYFIFSFLLEYTLGRKWVVGCLFYKSCLLEVLQERSISIRLY